MDEEETILDEPNEIKPLNRSRYDRLFRSVMFLAFAVFIIGILFRFQHWQGGGILLIISLSVLALAGCLRYFLVPRKTLADYVLIAVYATLPMGYLFKGFYWSYGEVIWDIGIIALILHLLLRALRFKQAD